MSDPVFSELRGKLDSVDTTLKELQRQSSERDLQFTKAITMLEQSYRQVAELQRDTVKELAWLKREHDTRIRTLEIDGGSRQEHIGQLKEHEGRITSLEVSQAKTSVKLGLLGGVAGLVSLLWQALNKIWG